ncbi:MAG: hypothetical protein KDI92_12260 [Xanthomonadales bacterium]|nr:hypothetical protein [Xanthomonadales bacterium]
MSPNILPDDTPPFWKQFGFFFRYLKQEKLYYQITLLAAANILLLIPSLIIYIIIGSLLFLASYKLAFEVLHTVSSGQFVYSDHSSFEIDDKIGFKAISMGVVQLLIFLFIYRYDPATGLALLILTMVVTPAFLMMLCKSQDLLASFNPVNLATVMTRIGLEYIVLFVFFIGCSALNIAFRYYTADILTGVFGDIISAWFLYFLLVFSFLVIGYVMYRHADDLGHDTVDTEFIETVNPAEIDPIKARVKELLSTNKPQEAIAIIKEIKSEDKRTDLDSYLSQAQSMQLHLSRARPADKLTQLVEDKQYRQALELYEEYLADGHAIKPEKAETLTRLIQFAFENNQFKRVLTLTRNFDKRYPLEYEQIVSNFFLVAKIYYQNKKTDQAISILQSLIKQYCNKTKVNAVSSYLKGIQKLLNH